MGNKKRVVILGANGKQGKLLMNEALSRGYDVGVVIRSGEMENKNVSVIKKDIFDLKHDDIKDFDVVISAFGAWSEDTLHLHLEHIKHLCEMLKNSDIRLMVVGSAGSLFVDKEHKIMFADTPDMPDIYKPLAKAMIDGFKYLRDAKDVKWTFLSPPADFQPDGARSGRYKIGGEEMILSGKGESSMSYADYAIAMIDEIENESFIGKRFSVVGE